MQQPHDTLRTYTTRAALTWRFLVVGGRLEGLHEAGPVGQQVLEDGILRLVKQRLVDLLALQVLVGAANRLLADVARDVDLQEQ